MAKKVTTKIEKSIIIPDEEIINYYDRMTDRIYDEVIIPVYNEYCKLCANNFSPVTTYSTIITTAYPRWIISIYTYKMLFNKELMNTHCTIGHCILKTDEFIFGIPVWVEYFGTDYEEYYSFKLFKAMIEE